jgi:hypothetical protein
LTVDQLSSNIYEELKEMSKQSPAVDSDWIESLSHDVFLRDAIRLIGEETVRDIYPLPPTVADDKVYRDGSLASQVVMEEVDEHISRYLQGDIHNVIIEVLDWSDAAQAEFQRRLSE